MTQLFGKIIMVKYWAFISYSHHDKRIARWLRQELRKQKIPRELRQTVDGNSNRIEAVFLDEETAAANSELSKELEHALDASQTLVVICSPFAVASRHVEQEIRYFQRIGRSDRILCLIASGVPNATEQGDPRIEAFPLALRLRSDASGESVVSIQDRPLAAVLGDETKAEKQQALRQIAAGILDISPARVERTVRIRRNLKIASIALLAAAAIAFWAAFFMPYRTYARTYVRKWGIWTEVDSLPSRLAHRLPDSYEFVHRGIFGKPKAVRYINGFGHCQSQGMTNILQQSLEAHCTESIGCEARFEYAADGSVKTEAILDQFGHTLETLTYTNDSVALFTEAGFGCSRSKSGVKYVAFERFANKEGEQAGLDHRIKFYGESAGGEHVPRVNENGAYGYEYEYEPNFHLSKINVLSAQGKAHSGNNGYAIDTFVRNAEGFTTERRFFNADGKPALSNAGLSYITFEIDEYGRVVKESKFSQNDLPTGGTSAVAVITYDYGDHGEVLKESYFDADGRPTLNSNLIAGSRYAYDNEGWETSEEYFDARGQPTLQKNGAASQQLKHDKYGSRTEIKYLGLDATPTLVTDGYAIGRYQYDNNGDVSLVSFFDTKGKPTLEKSGIAGFRNEFKDRKRISFDYVDTNGNPTLNEEGYGGIRYSYDANGNQIEEIMLDTKGQPTVDNNGVWKTTYTYNEAGQMVEQRLLGIDGRAAFTNTGVPLVTVKYDDLGRLIEKYFRNFDGELILSSYGYAIRKARLDAAGREIEARYYGVNSEPVRSDDGCFGDLYSYDDHGYMVSTTCLDKRDQPTPASNGAAIVKYVRDVRGNLLEGRYLGPSREPAVSNGISGWRQQYDSRDRVIEEFLFAADGKPVRGKGGYAGIRYTYDQLGNETSRIFLDEHKRPLVIPEGYAGFRSTFDNYRREISRTFLNVTLNPADIPDKGYATWKKEYDAHGREILVSYFNAAGKSTPVESWYAIQRKTYNERGNLILDEFFDEHFQPTNHAKSTFKYDQYGRQLERRFFDKNGSLIVNDLSGRAVVQYLRDAGGRILEERSLDSNEKPVDRKDEHWYRRVRTYSDSGYMTSLRCLTVSGKEVQLCKDEE